MSLVLENWEFKNWHLKGLKVIFWLFVSRCLAGVRCSSGKTSCKHKAGPYL